MMIRVKRPDDSWDEIPGGSVTYHENGGPLHVHTTAEPRFYEPNEWSAFELLLEPAESIIVEGDEVIFADGFT
jgi:hypothetical protein